MRRVTFTVGLELKRKEERFKQWEFPASLQSYDVTDEEWEMMREGELSGKRLEEAVPDLYRRVYATFVAEDTEAVRAENPDLIWAQPGVYPVHPDEEAYKDSPSFLDWEVSDLYDITIFYPSGLN